MTLTMKEVIFPIVEGLKKREATDGHFNMNNIQHTKGLTAVVSVYENIKPAHMVLKELYSWAEANNEEVKELIDTLKKDMTWNEDNPV